MKPPEPNRALGASYFVVKKPFVWMCLLPLPPWGKVAFFCSCAVVVTGAEGPPARPQGCRDSGHPHRTAHRRHTDQHRFAGGRRPRSPRWSSTTDAEMFLQRHRVPGPRGY